MKPIHYMKARKKNCPFTYNNPYFSEASGNWMDNPYACTTSDCIAWEEDENRVGRCLLIPKND